MRYIKMLGLAAVAAAAFMAFVGAGAASATILTAPDNVQVPVGTAITAEAEGTTELHPPIGSINCKKSHVGGKVTNAGGSTSTVSGTVEALSFTECNATVNVLKKGTLEVHTPFETTGNPATSHQRSTSNGNGTLTSTGAEVTVVFLGFHCIFTTNNTDLGTVTGYKNVGGEHATFDISATIPRTGGSSGAFCGTTAAWTGSYKITTPTKLTIH